MNKILHRSVLVLLTITMAACTSVDEDPNPNPGGSGGTAGTGGTAGAGGTAGTGGSAGTGGTAGAPAPTVTLTATPTGVATGSETLVQWDVTDAESCTATEDWQGTKSIDGGSEEFFVWQDSAYVLTCTGPAGVASDDVDVLLSTSQLLVSVDMSIYLFTEGDIIDVKTTVSNPNTTETVEGVTVNLTIPQYVLIDPGSLPGNATCSGSCSAGDAITWTLGDLPAGAVTTVTVAPEVEQGVPADAQVDFNATASATGEPDAAQTETTVQGVSDLSLALVQTPEDPAAGDEIAYSLTYQNTGAGSLPNVVVTLQLPRPVTFDSATGGGTENGGVVTWDLGTVAPGAMATIEATIDVNAQIPPGAQLRAEAGVSIDGRLVPVRATALGAVTDETPACIDNDDCAAGDFCVRGECTPPLLAENSFDSNPLLEGDAFRMFTTVTNPTETETVTGVEVDIVVPVGVDSIGSGTGISVGGTCNVSSCAPGRTITWTVGDLGPGESRTVWLKPTASSGTTGTSIAFNASATSVNAKTANAQGDVDVVGARAFNLRISESANPVAPGATMTYTLHYANQSNTVIDAAQLKLVTSADVTVTDAGGGVATAGEVTWNLGALGSGEGGTHEVVVAVNAASGEQVRTEGAIVDLDDPGEETRAIAQTPVGDSPLIAVVEVNSDPSRQEEFANVSVTVTNPATSSTTRNDVGIQIAVPVGVDPIGSSTGISVGGTCNVSSCQAGRNIDWEVGDLAPGDSRTVWLEPVLADDIGDGAILSFVADVRANANTAASAEQQTAVLASNAMLVRGARALNLRVVDSANPAAPGASMTYTLHYANQSNTIIGNAQLRLITSTEELTVDDAGGGTEAAGEVTWNLGELGSGEGGTRQVVVTVGAAEGEQVRTQAVLVDLDDADEEVRATVQTPVGDSPLLAFVEMNPDPSRQDELTNVSITVSNPSSGTIRSDVKVEVAVPRGVDPIGAANNISAGGTCNVSSCAPGRNITWQLGDLGPGESRVVSLEPIIASDADDGSIIFFEADVRQNAATTASAEQQTTVLAGAAMMVRGNRALNLRVVESANPVAPGASMTYTLHFANDSNSAIDDAQLRLVTPTGATTVIDAGGGNESGGEVTWALGALSAGETGSEQVVVTVNAAAGQQIRTQAVIVDLADPDEETRATVQTPVSEGNLATTVTASSDPVEPGAPVRITVTVENTSVATTEGPIILELQVPQGLNNVPSGSISAGGTCNVSSCAPGRTITWDIGNLTPGESTALDIFIDATVLAEALPGTLIFFESQTLVDDTDLEQRVVAGTTVAVEAAP